MNTENHLAQWLEEERIAHIHGWDFSHIAHRHTQEELPWVFREVIGTFLRPEMKLLDIDTGGGEFLRSLNHPFENTSATENYPPNVQLCAQTLSPLGIDFRPGAAEALPFPDGSFDAVINRHGDLEPKELWRLLKPGGIFLTQQVGAENDRELVHLLCGEIPLPFPEQTLEIASRRFLETGFTLLRGEETFRPIRFYDVGALVWFARILPWEFPGFSVQTHLPQLQKAQHLLEQTGCVSGNIHRFLLVAQKPY